ncbi:MAG: TRAP transporter small permease [Betaproteobacteria bacterium]|nr:TRAP transporter small permease [Betaproteobacteria bacterium]
MLAKLYNAMDQVGEWLAFAGMIMISVAIGASMVDIICRKSIGFSVIGIDDITQLMVMSCICLSMPLAYIREGHVGVEFITDPLPPRALAIIKALVALLTMVFVVFLVRYALGQALQQIDQGNKSSTLAIPIIWFWTPLLIGLGISVIASFTLFIRYLLFAATGVDPVAVRAKSIIMEAD